MNATLNRAELLCVAQHAAMIAPAASPISALEGVLLEISDQGLTLTATNMEIALQQTIACPGSEPDSVVINARLFAEMLQKMSGDIVSLYRMAPDPTLEVRCQDTRYRVSIINSSEFPHVDIPFPEDTVTLTGIPKMASHTGFAVGHDEARPVLTCINLRFTPNGLRAISSNGQCMVSAKGDDHSTGNVDLLVPANSLRHLSRLCSNKDELRVGTTGNSIVFFKDNLRFSARLMPGTYINSDQVIQNLATDFTILADGNELYQALSTATSVGGDGKVALSFTDSTLKLTSTGNGGAGETTIEIIPLSGHPHGQYWFQADLLGSSFRALPGTLTLGITTKGILTLSVEDNFYMQIGLRPPAADRSSMKKAA